jgi:uracil-DNA glycosylase
MSSNSYGSRHVLHLNRVRGGHHLARAGGSVHVMAGKFLPPAPGEQPQNCRRCDLWKAATQAVPGEGPRPCSMMLVGEQPGDEEDRRGRPFIGPAGGLLGALIEESGLQRTEIFVTNAVKHFKWEPRGKRRLHKKPLPREIDACGVWLEQEIDQIKPAVLIALGATALRALTGRAISIAEARSAELRHRGGARIVATYHPSAILRAEGPHARNLRAVLVADLRRAATLASIAAV